MELQQTKQVFPILNSSDFFPPTLGRILWVFYASNKKYFTVKELKCSTSLEEDAIVKALHVLKSFGQIDYINTNSVFANQFFVDTNGSIQCLKNSIAESKNLLDILENIIENRDSSNHTMNAFIKNTILFYSEILDFIDIKTKEHFNN